MMLNKLRGKLGLCQCENCFRRSKYTIEVDKVISRNLCGKHLNIVTEILKREGDNNEK